MNSIINNNLALSLSEMPIKKFVKETNAETLNNVKEQNYSLGFQGDEAKLCYEEIISIKGQNESLPKKNNLKIVKKSRKEQLDKLDKSKISVDKLFKTVETGDNETVYKYFDSKNVNVTDRFGWTPLMSAAYSGNVEIVNYFLKLGACVKSRDKSGHTAVDLATKQNHTDIVELLKESRKNKKKIDTVKSSSLIETTKQEKFYCDLCKIYFTETSIAKHESSTLHVFNTNPKIKNNFYGIPKCNRGYQMLLNGGWDEDGGLGPSGEGKKYPVKTILKRDRKGIGESKKKIAKVTHFNARDVNAVKNLKYNTKKISTKKEIKKQLRKDAAKTRALRRALS